MFYKLKKQYARAWFGWQIRGILDTKPMPVVDAPIRIVTLLGKPDPDILMYILAMKAFYRHIGRGRITIITDPETSAKHSSTLRRHFPGIELEMHDEIDPASCQKGGCWERLVYIIRRTNEEYVIQMDADTLAIGRDIAEVAECLARNISFTYADNSWPIKSMAEIAEDAKKHTWHHVGDVLERKFADWPNSAHTKYVKGSAGFSGFARGQFDLASVEAFHARMTQSLGDRWREWGTEQSASNYMIANAPGAVTLPFPEYHTGPRPEPSSCAKFIHFIGTNRYRDNVFADHGKRIIRELMNT